MHAEQINLNKSYVSSSFFSYQILNNISLYKLLKKDKIFKFLLKFVIRWL